MSPPELTITADARALVARTTSAQGLPEHIEDPIVLARVASILHAANGNAGPHHKAGVTNNFTITTTDPTGKEGATCVPS